MLFNPVDPPSSADSLVERAEHLGVLDLDGDARRLELGALGLEPLELVERARAHVASFVVRPASGGLQLTDDGSQLGQGYSWRTQGCSWDKCVRATLACI